MAPSDHIAARRALVWGLVVLVLVFTAVAGVSALRHTASIYDRLTGTREPPRISQQLIVDRLQTVAKLVATEMTLRDVVSYQQTRFGSTKRALLVVTGRVSAGIDLEHGTEVRIDSTAHKIVVSLPPAQILSVDVLDVKTY